MKGFLESDLRQHLSAADLRELQGSVTILSYPAGAPIYREGTPAEYLFIVRSGEALLSRYGRTLGLLPAGTLFGEGALLAEPRHLADVTAHTEVTAYGLRAADLAAYQQSRPTAAAHFLLWVVRAVTLRLQATNDLLGAIADVGQAATSGRALELIGHDVLEVLLRDIAGTAGAALFIWNRFTGEYEALAAIHLGLEPAACAAAVETAGVFTLRDDRVAGVRLGQDETVGVLFISRTDQRPPFSRAEGILLETVGQHLTMAIHRAQDSREAAARDRRRYLPSWKL
jgi:CRP-like cAMP-binding protein